MWFSPNDDIRKCLLDMKNIWTKNGFETWLTRNDVNGSYLIMFMALLFMFVCSIYRLFKLNRSWKRDSLQMMVFVNVCSTLNIVQLKTRFETSVTRNDVNGASLFNLCYLITHILHVLAKEFKYPNEVFYVWLVELNSICAKYGLETCFTHNDDIRNCLLEMKHRSTKNAFWDVSNKKWCKWCEFDSPFLFNNTYVYLCSQWTP
jgi:hypothetical protein